VLEFAHQNELYFSKIERIILGRTNDMPFAKEKKWCHAETTSKTSFATKMKNDKKSKVILMKLKTRLMINFLKTLPSHTILI
jgi:hypothetical protein